MYVGPTVFKGIKGRIYSADFGDMSNDPDLKCFCTTPKSCLKRGVHDLTKCAGPSHIQKRNRAKCTNCTEQKPSGKLIVAQSVNKFAKFNESQRLITVLIRGSLAPP
jgi:hypothetical protein